MGACGSTSTHADPDPHPLKPKMATHLNPAQPPAAAAQSAEPISQLVTARGGDLWLGGQKFRFTSLCAPELLDGDTNGEFEVDDTFRTLGAANGFARGVTRTYTLRVSHPPAEQTTTRAAAKTPDGGNGGDVTWKLTDLVV